MRDIRNGRIKYTHMYIGSVACIFASILMGVLLAFNSDVQDIVFRCIVVITMFGSAALGLLLRIRIRYCVYLDKHGIHVRMKHGGREILLPRSSFLHTDVAIAPRGSSVIILSKEAFLPAELAYISVHKAFPADKDVVKYGLEYSLNRLVRGEMLEQDFLQQPVIMLQFNYARKSMYKFYQRFLEVWDSNE